LYKKFYKEGICKVDFFSKKINTLLLEINKKKIKDSFRLETKYPKTWDLRPDVLNYDNEFLKVLKENNIKNVIKKATLRDLTLFHIQVRVVNNQQSYMNWHRDTYYDSAGNAVGKTPSGIKLIYYPEFNNCSEDRLLYLKGSNRIVFPSNVHDSAVFNILEVCKIQTENNKALLFDTSGLHAVCPEKNNNTSIRLIYSFLDKQQVVDDHSDDFLHMETMKRYERLWE
jgi:hypothetical protein